MFFGTYWALTPPRVTEVKIFFTKQTSMMFLSNDQFHYHQVCLPEQLQKKVRKMPEFENGSALF